MNITSAQYYNNSDDVKTGVKATIDGTEMQVPLDPSNRHYAALLEWVAEDGNTIAEAD